MAQTVAVQFHTASKIRCTNCGSIYELQASFEEISIEVCGNCHPFYTGQDVVLDTTGRIEKFQSRLSQVQNNVKSDKKVKVRKVRQTLADLDDGSSSEPQTVKVKEEKKVKPAKKTEEAVKADTSVENSPETVDNQVEEGKAE